jgi:hypothetical protein
MSTPSIQTLITQAQQVLNLKSSNEIRATLAAILANANVGTPLNPNLTTQQLWDEFYEIVRQPSDDIMSIITDQMMRMVFSPPAPGGAGADKQVIFNDMGVLAGDAGLVYNKTTDALTVAGLVTAGSATITGAATVGTTLGVTGVSTFAAGTVSLPALTTTGDTNTGIYYPAADTFAVTTGGTERIRANSSGLVGINTDPSSGRLEVMNNTDTLSNIVAYSNSSRFRTVSLLSGTSTASRNYYFVAGSSAGADQLEIRASGYASTDPSAATKIVSLTESGYLTLSTGDLVIGTSGRGIDFSATSSVGTSELLNDYEEGTWTPTFTAAIGTGFTVTLTSATYTKIGRRVFLEVDFTITVAGSASSALYFTLPFSQASSPSSCGAFRESNSTGYMGQLFHVDGTRTGASFYNDSTVWVNNYRLRGSYSYNV